MEKAYKFLLFLISLIGIGLSVCIFSLFYPVSFVTEALTTYSAACPWINYTLSGFNVFLSVCFLALLLFALFSPSRSDFLVIEKSKGNILFSKKTIESTARYSFADLNGISFSDVRVKFNKQPDKTKIYVKLSLSDASQMVALTEEVQNKIESALLSSLGIVIQNIPVKVVEFKPNNEAGKVPTNDRHIV